MNQQTRINVPASIAYQQPPYAQEEGVWSMPPYLQIFPPPAPGPLLPNFIMGRNMPGTLAYPTVISPKVSWLPPPLAQTYNFSAASQTYPL